MKIRDGLFAVATLAFALFSIASVIAAGEQNLVGPTTRAESIGFDALAHELFGADACVLASEGAANLATDGGGAVQ